MKIFVLLIIVGFIQVECRSPLLDLASLSANDISAANGTDFEEAASCTILNVTYNHGQKVKRNDECDYCLCVDGEMFCYWQCPTSAIIPTTTLIPTTETITPTTEDEYVNLVAIITPANPYVRDIIKVKPIIVNGNGGDDESYDDTTDYTYTIDERITSPYNSTTTIKPDNTTMCVVTGTSYSAGETLPREPGSCVQCICNDNGTVICTQRNCTSPQDPSQMDMFDVDFF